MTIRNISKDKYHATPVSRSVKKVQEAVIQGLNEDLTVLKSTFEWSVVSEMELAASESALGTLVSQGTTEWTINRRSIPAGIYQVKFNATITLEVKNPHGCSVLLIMVSSRLLQLQCEQSLMGEAVFDGDPKTL